MTGEVTEIEIHHGVTYLHNLAINQHVSALVVGVGAKGCDANDSIISRLSALLNFFCVHDLGRVSETSSKVIARSCGEDVMGIRLTTLCWVLYSKSVFGWFRLVDSMKGEVWEK